MLPGSPEVSGGCVSRGGCERKDGCLVGGAAPGR